MQNILSQVQASQAQLLVADLTDKISASEQQEIINNLLFIGMEELPLNEKLNRSLKSLFSTP